jgi:hypothetical protein
MKTIAKLGRSGKGVRVVWQDQAEATKAAAEWLAGIFFAAGSDLARSHRACFAIAGASAAGKTKLSIPLRRYLSDHYVPATLIRRDSFIRGKNSGRRWFDDAAVRTMHQQVLKWLSGEELSGGPVHLQNVAEEHCPRLPESGLILIEDLRRMPEFPFSGGICLIGKPAVLTRQEEKRNGAAWPWWEHWRRNLGKYRYQNYLIRSILRSGFPWLVLSRDPENGKFSGWMSAAAKPKKNWA